jgi:TPR repeat protein
MKVQKLISLLLLTLTVISANAQNSSTRKADAKKGNAEEQYQLGLCYETGDGVEKNMTEAAAWFRKAAEQGLAEAQYSLGYCYENGEGVAKDVKQAKYWKDKAAKNGYQP